MDENRTPEKHVVVNNLHCKAYRATFKLFINKQHELRTPVKNI